MDKILRIFGYENIRNIKIQEAFKNSPPRTIKFIAKLMYYQAYKRFEQPIVLNKNGYLIDGYTTYLISKGMGKKYVKVVRAKEEI